MKKEERIIKAMEVAKENGYVTAPMFAKIIDRHLTRATEVLCEAARRGLMEKKPKAGDAWVYTLTGLPYEKVKEEARDGRFDELLGAWKIPLQAPKGKPGSLHIAFT